MRDVDIETAERLLRSVGVDASLTKTTPLEGGISATMHLVEDIDGRSFVLRQPGDGSFMRERGALRREAAVLSAAGGAGVPVPPVIAVDEELMVLGWIPGVNRYDRGDASMGRAYARVLASTHRTPIVGLADLLPRRDDRVFQHLATMSEDRVGSLRVAPLVDWLRGHWHERTRGPEVLLHGDLWAGNVVWSSGDRDTVAAVIDWEDACIGPAVNDIVSTRLELLLATSAECVDAFLDELVLLGVDPVRDPVWECAAVLQLATVPGDVGGFWPAMGREDMGADRLEAVLAAEGERILRLG